MSEIPQLTIEGSNRALPMEDFGYKFGFLAGGGFARSATLAILVNSHTQTINAAKAVSRFVVACFALAMALACLPSAVESVWRPDSASAMSEALNPRLASLLA